MFEAVGLHPAGWVRVGRRYVVGVLCVPSRTWIVGALHSGVVGALPRREVDQMGVVGAPEGGAHASTDSELAIRFSWFEFCDSSAFEGFAAKRHSGESLL